MLSALDLVLGVRRSVIGSALHRTELSAAQVRDAIEMAHGELRFLQCDVAGTVQLNGCDIALAVAFEDSVLDTVDVTDATISDLTYIGCVVSEIRASAARFSRNLSFQTCRIDRASLRNTVVGGTLAVVGSSFRRFLASGSRINADCNISRSSIQTLILDGITIGNALILADTEAAVFRARGAAAQHVNARGASGEKFSLERAHLRDGCDFTDARIGSLSLDGLVAGDRVLLNRMHAERVSASQATFGAWEVSEVVLTGSLRAAFSTAGALRLSGTVYGSVDILDCEFRGTIEVETLYLSGPFRFERNRVSGSVMIVGDEQCIIEGLFSLAGTVVAGQIVLRGAWLNASLRLDSVRAVDIALINVHVGGNCNAEVVRVEGSLLINDAVVRGKTSLQAASALRIAMHRSQFADVDMLGVDVRGVVSFDDSVIDGSLSAIHCRMSGPLALYKTAVRGALDLTQASLGELTTAAMITADLVGFEFPPKISLRGCRYAAFRGSWSALLNSLDSQDFYDSDSYRALEVKLRENGRNDWAETVYYHSQIKGTNSMPFGVERLGRDAIDLVSGFGVRPFRLIVSAGITFILMALALAVVHPVTCDGCRMFDCGFASFEQAFSMLLRGIPDSVHEGIVLDLALLLRAGTLVFFGLFVAFVTGLLRYTTRTA